ncbi:MAG: alpha/beta hydrolase, partial [Methylococcales bacterium]|nr:alpha/beta hydrolase [Methylococcales bacterium]
MKVIVSKQQKDSVILLHGLNRSNKSMLAMEWLLKRANFDVINVDYPSREHPVETLAVNVLPQALAHVAHKK